MLKPNVQSSCLRWLAVLLLSGGVLAAGLASGPAVAEQDAAATRAQQSERTAQAAGEATETAGAGGSQNSDIETKTVDATAKQRERVIAEATRAIAETRRAVQALDEDDVDAALQALETATGKLELIIARRPELALAPVDVRVVQTDLYATPEEVTEALKEAQRLLREGEVQEARLLIADLASEIVVETVNLPLTTYPDAIKAAVPLIDAGDSEAAQLVLESALSTMIIRTEAVIPLPLVRAQGLLAEAETLAEIEDRSEDQNTRLKSLLEAVRREIELAERLDYGDDEQFQKMYAQLRQIEQKTEGGKSGQGFFDTLVEQLGALLPF